jgi:hypothetical protein
LYPLASVYPVAGLDLSGFQRSKMPLKSLAVLDFSTTKSFIITYSAAAKKRKEL